MNSDLTIITCYPLCILKFEAQEKGNRKKYIDNEENVLRVIKSMGFRGFPYLIASGHDNETGMRFIAMNK